MPYSDKTRQERLQRVGAFIAETRQFIEAKSIIAATYNGWQCGKEGTCGFLLGETRAGKTTVADDFLDDLRIEMGASASDAAADVIDNPNGAMPETWGVCKVGEHGMVRPVVKVFVGPRTRFIPLLRDTLLALGFRAPSRFTFGELMPALIWHLKKQEVRLLVFDEVHHIVERHSSTTPYEAADVFKMLLIQARVQIVCLGLPQAASILDANEQLEARCPYNYVIEPLAFDPHDEEGELRQFLASLEASLPFDAASDIASERTAALVHLATDGYVGRIVKLVNRACEMAIDEGLDGVKQKLLARAHGQVARVGNGENPFIIPGCDPESFAPIKGRMEKRRAAAAGGKAISKHKAAHPLRPSFQA